MKKFLFLGAMAAMLLGTASCSNEMEPEMTDGTVQFKVELPGNIDSRAIADGTTATKLDVACYDADGNKLAVEPTVKTDFVNREATVTYKLVKGQTYNFAFFAHADGAPYLFNAGTKLSECNFTVTDNYTGDACLSNAENRDAFYATLTGYEVTSSTTEVTLYRPFAQLNFGADDLAAAEAAGIIPGQSMVTVKQVATSFNLSTGATAGTVDATFALADRPAEKLVVDKEYDWMAMNYFLVPNNETNVDVEMTVKTADKNGTAREDVVVPVTSVPVKKNHRTNIVGSLFTQEANFKVIIDQRFDTPDYGNVCSVKNAEEFMNALNFINNCPVGGVIKIDGNVDLSNEADKIYISNKLHLILNERLTTQKGNQVCIAPSGDVTVEGEGTYETNRGLFQVLGGKLTVESGNFKTQNNTKGSGIYADGSMGYGSEITINGGNFDCAYYGIWNNDPYGKTVINGGVIKSSSMMSVGTWAYCVRNCGTLIVNNGWIDGIQGGIAIDYGHLEINGGYITTHDYYEDGVAQQQNHYALYLGDAYVGYTDDVIINGGYFYVEPTRSYPCIYDKQGINIEINGGYFNNLGRNNFLAGLGVTALDEPIQDAEHNATYSYKK